MPSGYDKDNFMRFLTQKCLFDTQKATWTCYWAATCERAFPEWKNDRERAIAAFQRMLATKKSERVVNLALQSVRTFMMFLDIGNNGASRPKIPPSPHPAKGPTPITSPPKQEESAAWLVYSAQLIKEVREIIRLRHLSLRTEKTYLAWTNRFLDFVWRRNSFRFQGNGVGADLPGQEILQQVEGMRASVATRFRPAMLKMKTPRRGYTNEALLTAMVHAAAATGSHARASLLYKILY